MSQAQPSPARLQGTILRVLQDRSEDGYAVLQLLTRQGTVRACGPVPFAMPGERLDAQGWWVKPIHDGVEPAHDRQDVDGMAEFRLVRVARNLPDTEEEVRLFLDHLTLRSLGRVALLRVVDKYGPSALRLMLDDPLRLAEIPGVPADRALAASDELQMRLSSREAAQWLVAFGLPPTRAHTVAKRLGRNAATWLEQNPYQLLEPEIGARFGEVDAAARRHGMDSMDLRRLQAAAEWILRQAREQGHVCLPAPILSLQTRALLETAGRPAGEIPDLAESSAVAENMPIGPVSASGLMTGAEPGSSPAGGMGWRTMDLLSFLETKPFHQEDTDSPAEPGSREVSDNQAVPGSREVSDNQAVPPSMDPACLVYLPDMLQVEIHVANRLKGLSCLSGRQVFSLQPSDWVELDTLAPWGWDALQRKVFADAGSHGVTVVTGGPGTGKTTLIKGLVRVFAARDMEVVLTAPTGRAARRMADATGMEARTVHRLLEVMYDVDGTEAIRFRKGRDEPLDAEVVILDEASMLDLPLFAALLDACADGTRLILVGDAEQLPSVGAGRVLGDLIESGTIPVTRLGQVFRQRDGSRIAANAQGILEGRFPEFSDEYGDFHLVRRYRNTQVAETVVRLCRDELPERFGFDPLVDIQVLSPMRKGAAGTVQLNERLREALNPQKGDTEAKTRLALSFRLGDRVMQNRNEYRQPWIWQDAGLNPVPGEGVYNGDMGTLVELDAKSRTAVVLFDDGREARYDFRQLDGLEPAYAVTVHKSQGSEYPVVVLALGAMPDSLACRNLLYTAITRAKRMVVLVGSEETLARMIGNNRNLTRYSGLALRLQGLI